ncbi:MFS transporter [Kangiella taiwanensis]|uniref:MFS transporter n=1 Tax=Kangiella taiwanensis TaxID=1079179 RepID=A0ABP8HQ65_9GAMM|nr:MFS transporter [Kangiella taiwanensis]
MSERTQNTEPKPKTQQEEKPKAHKGSRWSKPSWYWLPILMGLFQSTLIAATPTFMSITGLSTVEWSLLLSLPTLLFLFLSPQWGRWADRRGASYVIRYSALGLALSIVVLALVWWCGLSWSFAPWLWFVTIAVSRVLYGVSASGVMPVCQSLAIDASHQEQEFGNVKEDQSLKRLGFVSASLSIGRLCGPVVLILVASQIDWMLGFYSLITVPLVWGVMKYSRAMSSHLRLDKSTGMNTDKGAKPVAVKELWLFFALAFCVTLLVGYLQFVLGPLFLDWLVDADKATFMMSVTMTVVATTALLCQLLLVKRLNWRSPKVLLVLSLLLILATFSLGVTQSEVMVVALMVPIAMAIALITPIYSRFAMSLSQASKGQISGKLAVAHTAGYPLGSLFAGLSYGQFSLWWLPMLLIAIVIFGLCASVVWIATLHNKAAYAS